MSILTSSIGKEVNIFKDEYPLPKSSIEVLIPISLNRSNIRFTVETFFTRVLSVISIFNNLGSILFLLIHTNTKSRISSLKKCFADTFAVFLPIIIATQKLCFYQVKRRIARIVLQFALLSWVMPHFVPFASTIPPFPS